MATKNGVSVGMGVRVDVSVGGTAVSVGMAFCVSATMVKAAAMDVFCILTASIVGVAWAPQALTIRVIRILTKRI